MKEMYYEVSALMMRSGFSVDAFLILAHRLEKSFGLD
jgi:hypothetical protein